MKQIDGTFPNEPLTKVL